MNRQQADIAVGVLVVVILSVGLLTAVQFALSDAAPMGPGGSAPIMAIVMPVIVSVVFSSIVGGIYVYVRGQVFATDDESTPGSDETEDSGEATSESSETETKQRDVLAVLPEDERKILDPVVESPGVTQIEVRDRSGFSKSKVSQTLSELEERGLLYRERQGRTYRVYPADDLHERV